MINDRKWACPCCGGETVEAGTGRRRCVAGCRARHGSSIGDDWNINAIARWWTYDGTLDNTTEGARCCRDLPGPCGTRPAARAPTIRVGMRVERLHDDGEVRAGTLGTVRGINDDGDACVAWDSGSYVEYFNTTGLRVLHDDAATVATVDASASPSVASFVLDEDVIVAGAVAIILNRQPSCPRCGAAAPPDATGEPWCAACGAQTRYLRAEAPARDPHAEMRVAFDERWFRVSRLAAHGNFSAWCDYQRKDHGEQRTCIHVQRGRGATACVCERAERSGR